jgi:hypothetical protein
LNGTEEWRDVLGYEGYYEVSNLGHVRKAGTKMMLAMRKRDREGRLSVVLYIVKKRSDKRVHILVAEAFIRPMFPGDVVHHTDEDPTNNVVENLEIMTHAEHSRWHTKRRRGPQPRKLKERHIKGIIHLRDLGHSHASIAETYNVGRKHITGILNGKSWSKVSGIERT